MSSPFRTLILDLPDHAVGVSDVLEDAGFDVARTTDAGSVLRAVTRKVPEMILVNVDLWGREGRSLARTLKRDVGTRAVPIVALCSGFGPKRDLGALDAGCDAILEKPLDLRELPERIATFLLQETSTPLRRERIAHAWAGLALQWPAPSTGSLLSKESAPRSKALRTRSV